MKEIYAGTYTQACAKAAELEAQGYQTAVLISGWVRYWK